MKSHEQVKVENDEGNKKYKMMVQFSIIGLAPVE